MNLTIQIEGLENCIQDLPLPKAFLEKKKIIAVFVSDLINTHPSLAACVYLRLKTPMTNSTPTQPLVSESTEPEMNTEGYTKSLTVYCGLCTSLYVHKYLSGFCRRVIAWQLTHPPLLTNPPSMLTSRCTESWVTDALSFKNTHGKLVKS